MQCLNASLENNNVQFSTQTECCEPNLLLPEEASCTGEHGLWGSVHLNFSKTVCGNLQGDLLWKNAGNVLLLLLCDGYRKPVMFIFIKNTKDCVCRGVIIFGQILNCVIESSLASCLGSSQN